MKNRFCIYNFGCKVNQEEGGALAALFSGQGWEYAAEGEDMEAAILRLMRARRDR